jgi:hypothetical protein
MIKRWSLDARSREPTRPPLEKDEEKNPLSVSAFLLPLTASASSLLRQSRLETLLARRVREPRKKVFVCAAHPFHSRLERDRRKALVGRAQSGISLPTP